MRLLANENFPGDAVETLRARGHDVAWVRSDAPGMLRGILFGLQAMRRPLWLGVWGPVL